MLSSLCQQDVPETVDTDSHTVDGEGEVASGTVNSEAETVDNEAQPTVTDDTVDSPTHLLFHITCDSSDSEKLLKFLPRGRIKKDSREHVTIGRRETCDLRLNHPQASRDLLHITPTVNLNSSNFSFTIQNVGGKGISVNNMVLCKGAETPLTSGSVIRIDSLNLQLTVEITPGDDHKLYEVQFCYQVGQALANDNDRLTGIGIHSERQQPSSNSKDQNIPVCCTNSSPDQNEHLCGKHIQPPLPQGRPAECPHGQCTSRSKSVDKQASVDLTTVHELFKQMSLESSFGNGSPTQFFVVGSNVVVNMGGQGSDTPQQGLPNRTDSGKGEATAIQESSQSVSPQEGSPIQETKEGESGNQPVMCTDTQNEECKKSAMTDVQGSGDLPLPCPVEHDDRDTLDAKESNKSKNVALSDKGQETLSKVDPEDSSVAETVDISTRLTLVVHSNHSGLNLQCPNTTITKRANQPFLIAARNEKADVQIDDQRVSREHMQIEVLTTRTGLGFQLRKLKKNKIISVDGQTVDAEMPVQLKTGSSICMELPGSPAVKVEFGVQVEAGDATDIYEVVVKRQ
ncbi:uncharacterized protein [Branchiostoma lanceolatum]|uniref:uncharacterized protein n=1 Tax=Branchiostoma lanceolatum TaxID=7740 RepID=UPI003457330B